MKRIIFNILKMLVLSLVSQAETSAISDNSRPSNIYFECKQGFKFEVKNKAARCIKPKKFNYRPPLNCPRNVAQARMKLAIDQIELKDLCVLKAKNSESQSTLPVNKRPASKARQRYDIPPKCQKGYILKIRRGKDVCQSVQSERVIPVDIEVLRL